MIISGLEQKEEALELLSQRGDWGRCCRSYLHTDLWEVQGPCSTAVEPWGESLTSPQPSLEYSSLQDSLFCLSNTWLHCLGGVGSGGAESSAQGGASWTAELKYGKTL